MEVYIAVKHASFGDIWQVDLKGKWRAEHLLKLTKQFKDSTRSNDTLFISETEKRLFEEWLLDLLSTEDANVRLLSIRTTQIFRNGWQHLKAISDMKPSASLDKFVIAMPTDDDAIPSLVFDAIANNWHIRSLELTCHSEDDWNALANVLLHNPSITSCNILPCNTWHVKSRFFDALAKNQTLKQLKIQSRPMLIEEMHVLNKVLEVNTTLAELDIEETGNNRVALKINRTITGLKCIAPSMAESDYEYDTFCSCLLLNQSLTRLELSNCKPKLHPLIAYIQRNTNLKILSLLSKDVDVIVPELISVLNNHPSITDLTLAAIYKKNRAKLTAEVLRTNKVVKKFKLTGEISTATVHAICQSLYDNDTLTSLTLDSNLRICPSSSFSATSCLACTARAFSDLMAKNKTLQVLHVTAMTTEQLTRVLAMNSSLTSITVDKTDSIISQHFLKIKKGLVVNTRVMSLKINGPRADKHCKFVDKYITRNRNVYIDAAIIVHNIRRSDLFQLMPLEMWTHIFSLMGHPYDKHWDELIKRKA